MKVGFTASTFDLLHAGHVAMLREAKSVCDYLICGLQVDPTLDRPKKNQPVQSIVERQAQLAAIKYVDEVLIYNSEEELVELMGRKHYHVRFLGDDYRNKPITSPEVILKMVFLNRDHGFSSSRIRNKIKYLE